MRQVAEALVGKLSLFRISAQLTMTCQCSLLLCKIAHPCDKAIVHDTLPSARVSNVDQFLLQSPVKWTSDRTSLCGDGDGVPCLVGGDAPSDP